MVALARKFRNGLGAAHFVHQIARVLVLCPRVYRLTDRGLNGPFGLNEGIGLKDLLLTNFLLIFI